MTRWTESALLKCERYIVTAAFALYIVFQINAALHHGSWGQDFAIHKGWIIDALADPLRFLTRFENGRTNPPLFHLFAAAIFNLTGASHSLEVIALACAALNAAALAVLYRLLRTLIANPLVRAACITFILFLPVAMIHAVVLASDALATPIFLLILCLAARLAQPASFPRFVARLIAIAALIIVGLGVKFTFVSVIAALLAATLCAWRAGVLPRQRALIALLVIVCVPAAAAGVEYLVYSRQQTYNNGVNMTGSEMSVRSILFLRAADVHVLDAPPYDERGAQQPGMGQTPPHSYNLLIKDKFSYPALLHLGTYTDLLNIYQYDPTDTYFGARSATNQARMRLAVRMGVLFSLGIISLSLLLFWRSAKAVWLRKPDLWVGAAICLLGGCWLLNIAAGLPFVRAYWAGYWTPRLVLPGLLAFTVAAFIAADRLCARRRALAWGILLLVIIQSCAHASFLWPWENPRVELLRPAGGTILRGSTVQFVWNSAPGAEDYWLDVGKSPGSGDIWSGFTGGLHSASLDLGPYLNGQVLHIQVCPKYPGKRLSPETGFRFQFPTAATPSGNASVELISPPAGSILTTSPLTLTWQPVAGAENYWIDVGSAPAHGDIWAGATAGRTSVTVDVSKRLDGSTIYVQLYAKYPGVPLTPGAGANFSFPTAGRK